MSVVESVSGLMLRLRGGLFVSVRSDFDSAIEELVPSSSSASAVSKACSPASHASIGDIGMTVVCVCVCVCVCARA